MNTIVQTITLRSDQHYGRKVPPGPLGEVLQEIPWVVRYSICMAFGWRSRSGGRPPSWVSAASDIRLVDYQGRDDTLLFFELPTLGEAAPQLYQQQEFWPNRPEPTDTGFDLWADVIAEVAAENADSTRFDRPLLQRLRRFRKCLGGPFRELLITSRRYPERNPGVLSASVLNNADRLFSATPPPRQARVVGTLDMIRASTRTFALKLDDGEELNGVLLGGDMEQLKELFQRRVLVLGRAVYRASGRVLRIEASEVRKADAGKGIFSTFPRPVTPRLNIRKLLHEQRNKKGVSAVFGKWPGDETEEQLEQALRELS